MADDDDPPTLDRHRAADTVLDPSKASPSEPAVAPRPPAARYEFGAELGEGGMAVVHLAHDARLGRDVAIKVMRPGLPVDRFVREARIQGGLEHPGVVPVYDLDDTEASPYFTMKRISGRTMLDVLHADESFGLRRRIEVLLQVAQTVAYAHERGVIHRDLKPANVMLGAFGEIHVLDWGIARTEGLGAEQTEHGVVLGTPGYMAPEQAMGLSASVNASTDVYALGAMLYELLTEHPLHEAASMRAAIASTMKDTARSPAAEHPDAHVPPELDVLCQFATRTRQSDRMATAGAFARALRRWLDGHQDEALRARMADEHVERALRCDLSEEGQQRAVAGLGAALALVPDHARATKVLLERLLGGTDEVPASRHAEFEAGQDVLRRQTTMRAFRSAIVIVPALLSILFLMGVRSAPIAYAYVGCVAMAALVGALYVSERISFRQALLLGLLPTFASVSIISLAFGPLVVTPSLIVANASVFLVGSRGSFRVRGTIVTVAILSGLIPLTLQLLGVIPPSYEMTSRGLLIMPLAVDFDPAWTLPTIIYCCSATIGFTAFVMARATYDLNRAERRSVVRAWRLETLLPAAVRARVR